MPQPIPTSKAAALKGDRFVSRTHEPFVEHSQIDDPQLDYRARKADSYDEAAASITETAFVATAGVRDPVLYEKLPADGGYVYFRLVEVKGTGGNVGPARARRHSSGTGNTLAFSADTVLWQRPVNGTWTEEALPA